MKDLPGHKKSKKQKKSEEKTKQTSPYELTINITIQNTLNLGNNQIQIEQRAEGGGQINKDVGTNANQGGQNALNHSKTKNDQSHFADGNGRSGIAGDHNDEAGGQQGIKIRDSVVHKSKIKSSSEHSEAENPETDK